MMTCTRIEQLIPLYVEGDLDADAENAVRSHLDECEACRALVTEYAASQDWLHSYTPPDFDEALLDRMRFGVMRELQEQSARPTFIERFALLLTPRPIMAASAVALILIAALVFYTINRKPNAGPTREEMARQEPGEHQSEPQNALPPQSAKVTDHKPVPVQHPRRKRHPNSYFAKLNHPRSPQRIEHVKQSDSVQARDHRQPVPNESAEPRELLRIELQTADPNIRIIWLAPKETDTQELKPMIETR